MIRSVRFFEIASSFYFTFLHLAFIYDLFIYFAPCTPSPLSHDIVSGSSVLNLNNQCVGSRETCGSRKSDEIISCQKWRERRPCSLVSLVVDVEEGWDTRDLGSRRWAKIINSDGAWQVGAWST